MSEQVPPFNEAPAFSYTQNPNPEWKFGGGLSTNTALSRQWKADEDMGYKVFDPSKEEPRTMYKLMTSGIVPRPVAFISSLSKDGIPNLAPFSFFNMANFSPPMISVSICTKGEAPKDTARNIMDTKEFTVNIIAEPFAEAANFTSVEAPEEIDEWVGSGLTREPSTTVKPPRVRESAFSMECELYQTVPLAPKGSPDKPTGYLIIGLVKLFHVRNAVLDAKGEVVDPHKYKAISRMGDITYSRIGQGFRWPRPQWDDVKEEYGKLRRE